MDLAGYVINAVLVEGVLFFIEMERRWVFLAGVSAHPDRR